jgi:polyprenyl P-hydroxybenzoate/phenylacrylic acid decarboxylase-like protein
MESRKRLIVGITGASGAILGIELLRQMRHFAEWETHLVVTSGARRTIQLETTYTIEQVEALATTVHKLGDVGASIASGTFRTAGMVIVPCSMKTLAGVASGFAENLLLRAADVTLKERRPLVLVPRETPLNRIHLRNLVTASDAGAVILPPVVAYYNKPASVEEMTSHIVGKILDVFGISLPDFPRWGEQQAMGGEQPE